MAATCTFDFKKGSLVNDEFKIDHELLESKPERDLYEFNKENIPNRDEEHATVLLESLRNIKGVNGLNYKSDFIFSHLSKHSFGQQPVKT